jgi:FdhE protein
MLLQSRRLRTPSGKPDNPTVPNTSWQKRIRRAEQLAIHHPFAAEILGFYVHVAHFQEGLYHQLERDSPKSWSLEPSHLPQSPQLLSNFPLFLNLVVEKAPARFAEAANALRNSSADSWSNLLIHTWSEAEPPDTPEEYIAFTFLQPCAELARTRAALQLDGYTHSLCPFCNRKPAIAVLRPQGDGARRNLVCGFCLCEWEFRRIVCAGCGQEDQSKLPVYTTEQFPYVRVECCDACHAYIKSVDLAKIGLADPLVDELATVPLDLWAREHGYTKLRPNLLGL